MKPNAIISRLLPLCLACISLIACVGSVAYLTIGLTLTGIALTLLISIIGSVSILKYLPAETGRGPRGSRVWTVTYLFLALMGLALLFRAASDRALITPWAVVPIWEFAAYGAGTFLLIVAALRGSLNRWLLVVHYAWTFSVALIVYKIGYGFDPFIHQAAVKEIEAHGKIFPTTFYYLGQYSLVTIGHAIFGGPIALWDRLLVPVLAAVTLPLAAWHSLKEKLNNALGPVLILLLSFAFTPFILTTPQNLAYLFLLLAVIWSWHRKSRGDYILIWLLALASAVTQPIAGIPALAFAALLTAEHIWTSPRYVKAITYGAFAVFILALPLSFYIFAPVGSASATIVAPSLSMFSALIPGNPHSENVWLNFLYLIEANRPLAFLLLAAAGTIIAWKKHEHALLREYAAPATALAASAVAASAISFNFLIDYERSDYPSRILVVASLFLLPLAARALAAFWNRFRQSGYFIQAAFVLFFAAAITASFYLSYPRFDHYFNSRGYSTSKADILAVHWIVENAGGTPYIVLANQQVSAGALREFGFRKYFANNIFYYPIPTGGPLYQKYLDMIAAPTKKTMAEAMDLAGVDTAYFVVDEYWTDSLKVNAETRLIANATEVISDGQATVFKFTR